MRLTFIGIEGIPMIEPGDDLAEIISAAILAMGEVLQADDVLVLAQKVVSKAENRYLDLRSVTPSAAARMSLGCVALAVLQGCSRHNPGLERCADHCLAWPLGTDC